MPPLSVKKCGNTSQKHDAHKDVISIHDLSERIVLGKDLVKAMIVDVNDEHLQHTDQPKMKS